MVEFWVLGTGELLHKEFFEFGVRDFIRRYAQCYFKFFDDVVSNLIGVFYTLGIQTKVDLDVIFGTTNASANNKNDGVLIVVPPGNRSREIDATNNTAIIICSLDVDPNIFVVRDDIDVERRR